MNGFIPIFSVRCPFSAVGNRVGFCLIWALNQKSNMKQNLSEAAYPREGA
jgi:hypothetical protein